jgi:hypothetical protein
MIEGSGSVPRTNGSGSGSPNNIQMLWFRIRIPNIAFNCATLKPISSGWTVPLEYFVWKGAYLLPKSWDKRVRIAVGIRRQSSTESVFLQTNSVNILGIIICFFQINFTSALRSYIYPYYFKEENFKIYGSHAVKNQRNKFFFHQMSYTCTVE